jgi:hypothetical protein
MPRIFLSHGHAGTVSRARACMLRALPSCHSPRSIKSGEPFPSHEMRFGGFFFDGPGNLRCIRWGLGDCYNADVLLR